MPRARNHARIRYLIVTLSLVGCGQSSHPEKDATSEPARKRAATLPTLEERCPGPQTEATNLLDDAQACTTDTDCSSARQIDAPCLEVFLCPVSVANTPDLDRLRSEAQRLSMEYRDCTNTCAIADCGSVVGLPAVCNSSTQRCELQIRQLATAGASGQHD